MRDTEQRAAAKAFAEYWKDRGYEKGESQPFWLSLLRDVLGVEAPEKFIAFEEQVRLDHTSFIDGFIPATINYETPDPECDLDIVPNEGRSAEVKYAMSNSLGFGGHNATVVFKKYEG